MMDRERENRQAAALPHKEAGGRSRMIMMIAAAALLLTMAVGGTMAWLSAKDTPIVNKFKPSKVNCEVTEDYNKDRNVKSQVNVQNTGDTRAYIRVKLVTYRTNDAGEHIGGTAEVPAFTLGDKWVQHTDGYYYYTLPVEAGDSPATVLADKIQLKTEYEDADGGHQALDVMAEAIQSEPDKAVGEAWGVSIAEGRVTAYTGQE